MNYLFIVGAKYLYLIIVGIASIYFLKQTSTKKKQMIILGGISLPISYLVAKLGSFLFYNPRPFVSEKIIPLISHIADNGFPSDHTLLSSSIAFVIYFFNKKLGLFLFGLAFIVGISRIYVRIHHPIDILGSIIIAGVVVTITYSFLKDISLFKDNIAE